MKLAMNNMFKKLSMVVCLLALAACSGSHQHVPYDVVEYAHGTPKEPSVKIGPPYKVMGENYYPKDDPHYNEVGLASWYGPNFHGKSTANGERYNQWALTAAHRTLPMPSIVRVTDLDTSKSVLVRVNDRGPFAKGRIIDLSRAAAEELGIMGKGVANVRVEFVKDLTEQYISKNNLKRPGKLSEFDVASNAKRKSSPSDVSFGDKSSDATKPFEVASTEKASPIPDYAGDDETTLDVRGVKMEEIGYAEDAFAILDRQNPPAATPSKAYGQDYADAKPATITSDAVAPIQTVSFTPEDKKNISHDALKKNDSDSVSASESTAGDARSEIAPHNYFIQVGVFKQQTNAYSLAQKLADVAAADVESFTKNNDQFYRVTLGPTMNRETAEELVHRLPSHGVKDAKIIRKP